MFHRTSDIIFKETWIRIGNQRTQRMHARNYKTPDPYSHWCQPASTGFSSWKVRLKSRLYGCSNTHMNFEFSIKHWLTCYFVLSFKCTERISEWFNKRPIEWNFSHTSRCLLIFLAFIMKSNQIYVSGQVHNALHHFYKLLCWAATFIETTNEHKG